jgi:hypothetical protein
MTSSPESSGREDIRQQAKSGEAAAIATLLNKGLQAKPIKAQVKRQDHILLIRLLCPTAPNPKTTVGWIVQNLRKLQPEGITQVKIQARVPNAPKPAWGRAVTLAAPTTDQPSEPSPTTAVAQSSDSKADSITGAIAAPANPFDASIDGTNPNNSIKAGPANPFDEPSAVPTDSVTSAKIEPANPFDEPIDGAANPFDEPSDAVTSTQAEPSDSLDAFVNPSPADVTRTTSRSPLKPANPFDKPVDGARNPFDEPPDLTDNFVADNTVRDTPRSPATMTQLRSSAPILQPATTAQSQTQSPSTPQPPPSFSPQPDTWLALHWEWAIVNGLSALIVMLAIPITRSPRLILLLFHVGLAYLQTCIMARRLAKPSHWGIATLVGALLPFGTIGSGVGQWIVLRRVLPNADRWLVVNLITGLISLVLFFRVSVAAFDGSDVGLLPYLAIMAGWVIYIAGTTAMLWRLLGREPERLPSPPPQPLAYLRAFVQRPSAKPLPTEQRSRPSTERPQATAKRVPQSTAQPSIATDTSTPAEAAFAAPPNVARQNGPVEAKRSPEAIRKSRRPKRRKSFFEWRYTDTPDPAGTHDPAPTAPQTRSPRNTIRGQHPSAHQNGSALWAWLLASSGVAGLTLRLFVIFTDCLAGLMMFGVVMALADVVLLFVPIIFYVLIVLLTKPPRSSPLFLIPGIITLFIAGLNFLFLLLLLLAA